MNDSNSLPTTWLPTAYHVTGLVLGHANTSGDNSTATMVAVHWGALALGLIVLATAVGNVLLIVAVATERTLQNMTNYFLASLAVADLLVAVVVMPLAVVVQLYDGYFPLGSTLCIIWATMDVLMCTASIWHMATISVDRYCSLRFPLRYRRTKTTMFVVVKIAFVWVLSVGICSTLAIAGFVSTRNVYHDGMCSPAVSEFVIYGSIFAFYVPLIVMLVTYALTVRTLSANQRSLVKIWQRQMSAEKRQHVPFSELHVQSSNDARPDPALSSSNSSSDSGLPAPPTPDNDGSTPFSVLQATVTAGQSATRNGGPALAGGPLADEAVDSLGKMMRSTPTLPRTVLILQCSAADARRRSLSTSALTTVIEMQRYNNDNDDDDDDDDDEDVGQMTRCDSDVGSLKPTASKIRRAASGSNHVSILKRQTRSRQTADDVDASVRLFTPRTVAITPAPPRPPRTSARSAASARSAESKRKATRVLGVIFVVFVVFWTPFFVLNILSAACPRCVESVSPSLWTFLVWLGWTSSLANPVIYTSFSPAFRTAFWRIIRCRSKRSLSMARVRQQQWTSHLIRRRCNTE